MKKLHKFLAVMMGFILISLQTATSTIAEASTIVSGGSVNFELKGTIDSKIISVVMPTEITFAITPDSVGWNKMLSPDFTIVNTGNMMVNISISKADIKTANVQFTTDTPTAESGTRQVRIGIAPKQNYSGISAISTYLFNNSISDSNPVRLMNNLDYSTSNNTGTFSIYGDISTGWGFEERLNIMTVFKINLS